MATNLTLLPLIMLMTAHLLIYKEKQYTLCHSTRGYFHSANEYDSSCVKSIGILSPYVVCGPYVVDLANSLYYWQAFVPVNFMGSVLQFYYTCLRYLVNIIVGPSGRAV
jgi:hypothetical protein